VGGFGGGGGAGSGMGTGITGGGITMGGLGLGGAVVQAANDRATAAIETSKLLGVYDIRTDMWLLMIEALVALFLLVFIVWWTMYAGRKDDGQAHEEPKAPALDKRDTPEH
jgi:hypothetical protein